MNYIIYNKKVQVELDSIQVSIMIEGLLSFRKKLQNEYQLSTSKFEDTKEVLEALEVIEKQINNFKGILFKLGE